MQLIEIRINCPDRETAGRIGEKLVAARLAACANIGAPIDSIYRWEGTVERATETPLLVKSRASLFQSIAAEVAALHPWEVPAVTATEIRDASPSYRDWIIDETRDAPAVL